MDELIAGSLSSEMGGTDDGVSLACLDMHDIYVLADIMVCKGHPCCRDHLPNFQQRRATQVVPIIQRSCLSVHMFRGLYHFYSRWRTQKRTIRHTACSGLLVLGLFSLFIAPCLEVLSCCDLCC